MIIGVSGKKQSGKGVLSHWLVDKFNSQGISCKIYSFAGNIKEFFHNIMGLTYNQVYGSDDDKNTLTNYKWENMPFYEKMIFEHANKINRKQNLGNYFSAIWNESEKNVPKGFMTAREIMQTFGTEIGRRMNSEIWVEKLMRQIEQEKDLYKVQIIDDVRFENEAEAVLNNKGQLYRLTRKINNDNHESEIALDDYTKFTQVFDNQNMTKDEFIQFLEYNWKNAIQERDKAAEKVVDILFANLE